MSDVTVERSFAAFGTSDNIRMANDEVELILPTSYGPRVMAYSRRQGSNVLGVVANLPGKDTPFGDRWHIRGGHRLWYAPEDDPRTYFPDNAPVDVACDENGVTLVQAPEPHSHIQKRLRVTLAESGSRVDLVHELSNRGSAAIALAPWALTVMARAGLGLLPHPPYKPHPEALAPARPLVMWPFTRMTDPRWTWGERALTLRDDPSSTDAQKIGAYDPVGWLAYAIGDQLFVKTHQPQPGAHADFGCNVEMFTNEAILELETLGPLVSLTPGQSIRHLETWFLFGGVQWPEAHEPGAMADLVIRLLQSATATH